jgi:hypothetical protein
VDLFTCNLDSSVDGMAQWPLKVSSPGGTSGSLGLETDHLLSVKRRAESAGMSGGSGGGSAGRSVEQSAESRGGCGG